MQTPVRYKWYAVRKKPHVPEWDKFEVFEAWCKESGFAEGFSLYRKDASEPFGPDNCYWGGVRKNINKKVDYPFVKLWNKTVNRFRRAAGLPLFKED